MTIKEAEDLFKQHQKSNVKKNTLRSYSKFLDQFQVRFSEQQVVSMSPDAISLFLEECTDGLSRHPGKNIDFFPLEIIVTLEPAC